MKKKLLSLLLLVPLLGACSSQLVTSIENPSSENSSEIPSSSEPLHSSEMSSEQSSELSSEESSGLSSEETSSSDVISELSSEQSSEYSSELSSEFSSEESLESSSEYSSEETYSSEVSSELSSEQSSETTSSSEETIPETYYYDDFFNPSSDVKITIRVSNQNAKNICEYGAPYHDTTQDIYFPIDLTISVNGVETYYPECGMRIKGNLSRSDSASFFGDNGKINGGGHFKISFNETFEDTPNYTPSEDEATLKARRFGNAKKLDIKFNRNHDYYFTKEAYASHIFEEEGLLAQKINLAKIKFVTDSDSKEYLYQVQEVIGEEFLEERLPKAEAKGDLYKCGWVNNNNVSLTNSDPSLMGVENKANGQYYTYDLKTNKKKSTHQSLINLINVLNANDHNKDDTYLKSRLESVVDVDYFLKFAALEYVVGNPDSMRYNYNNTYLYFNSGNSLLYPIMFDNDRCFGIMDTWEVMPTRWPTTTKDINGNMQTNPLYARTVCASNDNHPLVKEYQERYLTYLADYAVKYLDPQTYYNFNSTFFYTDRASSYANISFDEYAQTMLTQINDCLDNYWR